MANMSTVRQLVHESDRDLGDYDPTEVNLTAQDVYHPSHEPAKPPAIPTPTATGRELARSALALCRREGAVALGSAAPKALIPTRCWRDTPEPFRRLVARAAGLTADVVDKVDRDLTETEKAMIRAAAKRLKERADALFAL